VNFLSSLLYTLFVGAIFVYIFVFVYDLLYGEKHDKQRKKIQKYFKNETIKEMAIIEHQPRKFTIYQVKTDKENKRVKVKPGYKVVKLVSKKK
jgi:hypothetical protein